MCTNFTHVWQCPQSLVVPEIIFLNELSDDDLALGTKFVKLLGGIAPSFVFVQFRVLVCHVGHVVSVQQQGALVW